MSKTLEPGWLRKEISRAMRELPNIRGIPKNTIKDFLAAGKAAMKSNALRRN